MRGWLYNRTPKGKLQFIVMRDGTGMIQAVAYRPDVGEEVWARCESLTQESSIIVTGLVRKDARALGGYELSLKNLEIVQIAEEYPITLKEHGTAFLMEHRHLWLRSTRQHAILKIRAEIIKACRDFLDDNGFTLVDTPILTPAACEGTTTLFETDYFGEKAFLSQSGQLYNEATIGALGRIYCFGPTFRAEKSKTRRHLMEFWMIEPEVAFYTQDDNMRLQEEFVSYIVQTVLAKRGRRAEGARARHDSLAAGHAALPAHHLRRGGRDPQEPTARRLPGATTSAATRRRCWPSSSTSRSSSPTTRPSARPSTCSPTRSARRSSSAATCSRPKATARSSAAASASTTSSCWSSASPSTSCRAEAFAWYLDLRRYGTVPALRLRHGHRAHRRLDLQAAAHPRDHPVPAHAGQDLPIS